MNLRPDPSVDSLKLRFALYRRLLTVLQKPRSEAETIRFAVDALWESFPQYRVAYATLSPEADFHVIYNRSGPNLPDTTGLRKNVSRARGLVDAMTRKEVMVIGDIRLHPATQPIADVIFAEAGTLARIDFPFEEERGTIGMITLSHSEPQEWDPVTVEVFREIAELVRLLFREARAQDHIKYNESIFRQFSDNISLVFWMVDAETNQVLFVSPSYEEVWGRSVEELARNPLSFVEGVHPEDRNQLSAAFAIQRRQPWEKIYRVIRPDGSIRWVKDRSQPIRNERGEVYRLIGFVEDITELKLAQERLEATQAQVISNAKFAALGEMASGIAHEINNPLAVIHGLAAQLRELSEAKAVKPELLRENLETIEKMTNRIASIVKGLRTFSRQTDRDPLVPTDLVPVIRETLSLLEGKRQKSHLRIKLEAPATPLLVRCRSSEISQVVLNLLNNAFDAAADCTDPRISLQLSRKGPMIHFAVTDYGRGVDSKIRDRIFEPFFTTKEVGRGTGLGLSISKGIVEAHGGRLFLDEKCANGTRFVVELVAEA